MEWTAELVKMESNQGPDFDNVDRISILPDHLICYILSFLPTEESAATSVLSTRWRYLFASVPDIDLLFDPTYDPQLKRSELNSLDSERLIKLFNLGCRILHLRDKTQIRKFKLSLYWVRKRFHSDIDCLVSTALQFKIQELDVFVEVEIIPYAINCPGIFTCESLVRLKLLNHSDVPRRVFLPNLKVLYMFFRGLVDDSVQRLIQGCPLLEELSLELFLTFSDGMDTKDTNVEGLDFSSPSIKKLEIRAVGGECKIVMESKSLESLQYASISGEHRAIFNVPNLKEFCYKEPAAGVRFIGNLESLVASRIGVGWLDYQQTLHVAIDHLYRALRVKSLTIDQRYLQALHDSQDVLPTFNNLISLELGPATSARARDYILSWRVLPRLFEKAPNLEVLIFNEMALNNTGESNELERLFLEALPICFIKQLKEIKINIINDEQYVLAKNYEMGYELKLIEYLLQHGKALKEMVISSAKPVVSEEMILLFERGSEDCKILLREAIKYYS